MQITSLWLYIHACNANKYSLWQWLAYKHGSCWHPDSKSLQELYSRLTSPLKHTFNAFPHIKINTLTITINNATTSFLIISPPLLLSVTSNYNKKGKLWVHCSYFPGVKLEEDDSWEKEKKKVWRMYEIWLSRGDVALYPMKAWLSGLAICHLESIKTPNNHQNTEIII